MGKVWRELVRERPYPAPLVWLRFAGFLVVIGIGIGQALPSVSWWVWGIWVPILGVQLAVDVYRLRVSRRDAAERL